MSGKKATVSDVDRQHIAHPTATWAMGPRNLEAPSFNGGLPSRSRNLRADAVSARATFPIGACAKNLYRKRRPEAQK